MKKNMQFDSRYALKPGRMTNPGLQKRSAFVVTQQQELQRQITRRPPNIGWFERQLEERGRNSDRPLIGVFCNIAPRELVEAMGARPLRLCCGNAALVQAGEEVLHGEICPLVKSSFAEFLAGDNPVNRCAALVLPTTCDPKRKLGEVLADYKPVFMLNLPPEQDARRFARMVTREFERMSGFLGDCLGVKLRRKPLLAAIAEGRRRSLLARRLQAARAANPAALSIRDAMIVIQAADAAADMQEWLAQTSGVLEYVERFEPERRRLRPRMVLTGAPVIWPNFKILNLLEESGADIVADTLCSGFQGHCDVVSFDETGRGALLRALAERYVFGSVCPCFVSQANRISRVLELAGQHKADGVVNYGLRLCQLFDMEVYRLSAILKDQRIPFVNIRTDYSMEDTEQLRVRLEAFLETVGET